MKAKKLFPDISFRRLVRHAVPVDNLESTDTDRPLSANMGREVNDDLSNVKNDLNDVTSDVTNLKSNTPKIVNRSGTTTSYQLEDHAVYLAAGAHYSGTPYIAMIFTYNLSNGRTPIIHNIVNGQYATLTVSNTGVLTIDMQWGHVTTLTKL